MKLPENTFYASYYGVIDYTYGMDSGVYACNNPVQTVMVIPEAHCIEMADYAWVEVHYSIDNGESALDFFTKYRFPAGQHYGTQIPKREGGSTAPQNGLIHFKHGGGPVELGDGATYVRGGRTYRKVHGRTFERCKLFKSYYGDCATGGGPEEGGWSSFGKAWEGHAERNRSIRGDSSEYIYGELYKGQHETTAGTYYC